MGSGWSRNGWKIRTVKRGDLDGHKPVFIARECGYEEPPFRSQSVRSSAEAE